MDAIMVVQQHEEQSTVLPAVADGCGLYGDDREWFHLVLTYAAHGGEVAAIREALGCFGELTAARAGASVMQCGGTAAQGDLEVAVGHGRLRIDALRAGPGRPLGRGWSRAPTTNAPGSEIWIWIWTWGVRAGAGGGNRTRAGTLRKVGS